MPEMSPEAAQAVFTQTGRANPKDAQFWHDEFHKLHGVATAQQQRVAALEAALRDIRDNPSYASKVKRRAMDALQEKPTGRYCTCLHDAPNIRGHDSDCPLATGGKDDA